MIQGLGTDLVSLQRISEALKSPRFATRILTPAERLLGQSVAFVAGRWAAKEAIYKALNRPLNWHDIEILNDADGSPIARVVSGETVLVSISHEREFAVAVALWQEAVS